MAVTSVTPDRHRPSVAVVVPVLVEPDIDGCLASLSAQRPDQVVVVHAGDTTTTDALARWCAAHPAEASAMYVLSSARGRARQMNAGARAADADILLFLHADTILPDGALDRVRDAVANGALWGRFDVRLSGRRRAFRVIEFFMNLRSACTGIVTGDQALFVRRDAFRWLNGFAPIELMEDVELSTRLKWLARPYRIRTPVSTSSRRWERDGVVATVLRMWLLRALYAFGVSPRRLARWYK